MRNIPQRQVRKSPMNNHPFACVIAVVFAVMTVPSVTAHEEHNATQVMPGRDVGQAQVDVDPTAAAAVTTVDRFSTSLGAGAIDKAVGDLDPNVLILESGGVERSRDEYLAEHAKADAEFLKGARVVLKRRIARASGDLAWVASE